MFFPMLIILLLSCNDSTIQSNQIIDQNSIDLSSWKLTLPVDHDKDGRPDEIVQPQLNDYQNITSIKPYMYNGEDGSLVFYCPFTGVTTPNSSKSRTELREQIVPGNNNVNWSMADGGKLSGRLKLAGISEGHRTIVMQIHGRLTDDQKNLIGEDDNDAPPLLKIYIQNNKVRVVRKILGDPQSSGEAILHKSAWTDDESYYYDEVVNNDAFNLKIMASAGKLEIIMNNVSKVYEDTSMEVWPFENYFKAGNYFQSTEAGSFAEVRYHSLVVSH